MSMTLGAMSVNLTFRAPLVCYSPRTFPQGGFWIGDNPLDFRLTLFLTEVFVIVAVSRATAVLLQPLCLPRYVVEIIGGIILGPTALGNIRSFALLVFPLRSVLALETIAQLGLIYFMFTVGVETELSALWRTGRAVAFAVPCIVVPFAIGAASGMLLHEPLGEVTNRAAFATLLGITLSITSFSALARTLAELKLLSSPMGATALSSAMLVDSCAWLLLAIAITLSKSEDQTEFGKATLATMLSGMAFCAVCLVLVRPAVAWVEKRTPEGEEVDDLQACLLLVGVMVAALAGEAIGIHAISGAFVYGLVFPKGPLAVTLIERVKDFTEGLLLPLFFAMSGLRTNLRGIRDAKSAVFLALVPLVAATAKAAVCLLVSFFFRMPLRDGFAIGLLMNAKGVIELVMLNLGQEKGVMSNQPFSILVLMLVVVTGLVRPLLMMVVQPEREGPAEYDRRMVQWPKPDAELRMLVCVHTTHNVPPIIGLLEASHPTKRSPIFVYALHLIELTGRASATLVHGTANQSSAASGVQAQYEHIVAAFESYEQRAQGVVIQPLTVVSPFTTMHEDVCSVAADNGVALIVLPFHKQQTVDSGMEVTYPDIRSLNYAVLATAPCSVAILVDRGFDGRHYANHHVAVIFIGGPDDREALAYASRMAEHPDISLLVLRLLPGGMSPKAEHVACVAEENELQRKLDEECLAEFRLKKVSNESVMFKEEEANNAEETFAAIRELDSIHDLYIVGRGEGRDSPLTAGLTEWSDCPELGPIGAFLASLDFAATASVLVVQQCAAVLWDRDTGLVLNTSRRGAV